MTRLLSTVFKALFMTGFIIMICSLSEAFVFAALSYSRVMVVASEMEQAVAQDNYLTPANEALFNSELAGIAKESGGLMRNTGTSSSPDAVISIRKANGTDDVTSAQQYGTVLIAKIQLTLSPKIFLLSGLTVSSWFNSTSNFTISIPITETVPCLRYLKAT